MSDKCGGGGSLNRVGRRGAVSRTAPDALGVDKSACMGCCARREQASDGGALQQRAERRRSHASDSVARNNAANNADSVSLVYGYERRADLVRKNVGEPRYSCGRRFRTFKSPKIHARV